MSDWRSEFVRRIREGKPVTEAVDYAGVSRDAPYKRVKRGDRWLEEQWAAAKRAVSGVSTGSRAA